MIENVIPVKGGITINVNASVKIQKIIVCIEKHHICNPVTSSCKSVKYLVSVIDDSVIMCHGILEKIKTTLTKTVPAKAVATKTVSTNRFNYILLTFLLINIALLIDVSIYLYQVRKSKTKPYIAILHHKGHTKRSFILRNELYILRVTMN